MKKLMIVVAVLAMTLVGCGSAGESGAQGVGTTVTAGSDMVDLTKLSSNMVYGEVFNMTTTPEDYIGKTVKMQGTYTSNYYEETGLNYHYVLIEDAAECCASGIEFIWGDNTYEYPAEYPEDGAEIEIEGTYSSYEELGYTYYYVAVDDIVVK